MNRASSHHPPTDLATARADLRELQHHFPVVQQQEAWLLRAIRDKRVEVDELEHPELGAFGSDRGGAADNSTSPDPA